jgi:dsDNA-specific endonuclease/ATPase MutS2
MSAERAGVKLPKSPLSWRNGQYIKPQSFETMTDFESIELPIDGVLDLHTFHPRDVKPLVEDYLTACRERAILKVRIIHGKGTGALRETVHALLRRLPGVKDFYLAGEFTGGWGATIVELGPASVKPDR